MAAARPSWRGQLRLSLVSIAVELFPAEKSTAKTSFRQIHKPSGKPINYEKVVRGIGPVNPEDIAKGYEYEKGQFVLLEDEEIDSVRLETKKTVDLVQFVDAEEISPYFFDKSYYVVPADELAQDAFRVIRDALAESNKIGLGQMAMRGGEYLVAVQPIGKGIMLNTLHYVDEVRKPEPFFTDVSGDKAEEDLLEVAMALINRKTAPFNPAAFTDHYQAALHELIEAKLKAKDKMVTLDKDREPVRSTGNVIDLMAALKKSLEAPQDAMASKPAKGKLSEGKASESKATESKPAPKRSAKADLEPAAAPSPASRRKTAAPTTARAQTTASRQKAS